MNVITKLELELTYKKSAVQSFKHYNPILNRGIIYCKLNYHDQKIGKYCVRDTGSCFDQIRSHQHIVVASLITVYNADET